MPDQRRRFVGKVVSRGSSRRSVVLVGGAVPVVRTRASRDLNLPAAASSRIPIKAVSLNNKSRNQILGDWNCALERTTQLLLVDNHAVQLGCLLIVSRAIYLPAVISGELAQFVGHVDPGIERKQVQGVAPEDRQFG